MGLGLMGGSLAKAIKAYAPAHITAITRNKAAVRQALADQSIDTHCTLEALDPQTNLVFVCTPMQQLIGHIKQLCMHCSPETLITDIGSVKGYLAAENFPDKVILGHPIAGREKTGYAYALADLFQNRPYVLIPPKKPTLQYKALKKLIIAIGSQLIECDAETHDKQLAMSSHFPYFAAKAALDLSKELGLDPRFVGPGFESFTRVGHSDAAWGDDLLRYNAKAIQAVQDAYLDKLSLPKQAPD
eukprot:COSAG01_NODE_4493_length_4977_cov_332.394208_8_plen_244_part_00